MKITKVEAISGIVLAACIGIVIFTNIQRDAEEKAAIAKAQLESQRLAEENRKLLEERQRNEERQRQADEQARLAKQRQEEERSRLEKQRQKEAEAHFLARQQEVEKLSDQQQTDRYRQPSQPNNVSQRPTNTNASSSTIVLYCHSIGDYTDYHRQAPKEYITHFPKSEIRINRSKNTVELELEGFSVSNVKIYPNAASFDITARHSSNIKMQVRTLSFDGDIKRFNTANGYILVSCSRDPNKPYIPPQGPFRLHRDAYRN